MMLKRFIYYILYYSGLNYIYSLFLNRRLFVVMYHSVSSPSNSGKLKTELYGHISINSELFESQIAYMKERGHTFILFRDLDKLDLKKIKKPTIIYFDDGFKDVLLNAVPILEKHKIPATLFLVSGILDHSHMLWTVKYREILSNKGLSLDEQTAEINKIKNGTEKERIEIMSTFPMSHDPELFNSFLSWEDIRVLLRKGFEIGSHGVSHTKLTEVNSEEITNEIKYSKERFEKELGIKIDSFSFPHGRGNEFLVEKLKEAGYRFVVSSGKGINNLPDKNKLVNYFKNISPKPDESLLMFVMRLYLLNIKS